MLVSSYKILRDMALTVGAKVSWTTTRLVAEALDHGLHVICSLYLQILYSALVMRENMDIGSSVIDDLKKKSRCVQNILCEIVDAILALRDRQLNFIRCGLGLEEPTDDIALDVPNDIIIN